MTDQDKGKLNKETLSAWNANAQFWDHHMGEGNDFFNILLWPAIVQLLDPKAGMKVLDIATGNGLTARRLAGLGVDVAASDFSPELIRLARERTPGSLQINYSVVDATDHDALLDAFLPKAPYDAVLCNMALFDVADIEPLFLALPKVLRPGGVFVYTLTHPAFNNTSCKHVVEEIDDQGEIKTVYSVRVSKYMTSTQARGLAMRGQPRAQWYFDRPLQAYLHLGFENGFILDGFEEQAFPMDHPQGTLLGWGGKFSEIPPVLAVRMRLLASG